MPTEASIFNTAQIEMLPATAKRLRKATSTDPVLSKVMKYSQHDWPAVISEELKPFYHWRYELTTEAGCLLWGTRVVIPTSCRADVLKELHTGHPGIVIMKALACVHAWWPLIDEHIEGTVRSCMDCQSIRNTPPASVLHPWAWPDRPWQRIHVDFAGPFQGSMFLVVVDTHSKWVEVVPMTVTTKGKTLYQLSVLFAAYGFPEQLVSDNGPQFTSLEFEQYMNRIGIKHVQSAPGHPSTNGEAERFIQTIKRQEGGMMVPCRLNC